MSLRDILAAIVAATALGLAFIAIKFGVARSAAVAADRAALRLRGCSRRSCSSSRRARLPRSSFSTAC